MAIPKTDKMLVRFINCWLLKKKCLKKKAKLNSRQKWQDIR